MSGKMYITLWKKNSLLKIYLFLVSFLRSCMVWEKIVSYFCMSYCLSSLLSSVLIFRCPGFTACPTPIQLNMFSYTNDVCSSSPRNPSNLISYLISCSLIDCLPEAPYFTQFKCSSCEEVSFLHACRVDGTKTDLKSYKLIGIISHCWHYISKVRIKTCKKKNSTSHITPLHNTVQWKL